MNNTPNRYDANRVARMIVGRMVHEVAAGLNQEQVDSVLKAKEALSLAQNDLNMAIQNCIRAMPKY